MSSVSLPARGVGWGAAAVAAAAVAGVLVALSPLVAGALVALVVLGLLARTPLGRLLLFTLGVLFVFQSDAGGSLPRLAYTGLIILLAPLSWVSFIRSDLAAGHGRRWRLPLMSVTVVAALVVVVCSLLALQHSVAPVSDTLRDATTYVLILCGVPYGLDAGAHVRARTVDRLAVVVGVIGALAFMVAWLSRRGQPLLGLDQFALASSAMVLPGIAIAFARYFRGGRRALPWLLVGLLQTALIIGSGGRGTILYLGALIGSMLVLGPKISRGPSGMFRTVGVLLAGVMALVAVVSVSTQLLGSDFLAKRLDWFNNASFAAVQSDGSGQERLRAYGILQDAVHVHPFFGYGFGHTYPSVKDMMIREGTFTLDSPLILPAKFGIIGAAALVLALVLVLAGLIKAGRDLPGRAEVMAIVGSFGVSLLASLPAGSPTEQKGFGVAIALLVAACVARLRPDLVTQHLVTPDRVMEER